jgi:hypothetical protein
MSQSQVINFRNRSNELPEETNLQKKKNIKISVKTETYNLFKEHCSRLHSSQMHMHMSGRPPIMSFSFNSRLKTVISFCLNLYPILLFFIYIFFMILSIKT